MTKNEYIASIMLEAADLLKEDGTTVSQYDVCNALSETVTTLCETYDTLSYKYFALTEGQNWNKFKESAKQLGSSISGVASSLWHSVIELLKRAWEFFKGLFTKKAVAKKDATVINPNKAKQALAKITYAVNTRDLEDLEKVPTVEQCSEDVRAWSTIQDYNPALQEANKILNQLDPEKEKNEPPKSDTVSDKDIILKVNEILRAINDSMSIYVIKGPDTSNITLKNKFGSDEIAQKYDSKMKSNTTGNLKNMVTQHNSVELLYDQLELCESAEDMEIILNAIKALED